MDPSPFTFAELIDMHRGREMAEWQIAAQVMATMARCHGSKRAQPWQFDPYAKERRRSPGKGEGWAAMKAALKRGP